MKKFVNKIILGLCVISLVGILTACSQTSKKGEGFEELGLACSVEEGVEYDYVTTLSDDTSKSVILKAVFSDHDTCPHPEREGYELRSVNLSLTVDNLSENAAASIRCLSYVDYYSLNSEDKRAEGEVDSTSGTETVTLNGTEYEVSYSSELTNSMVSKDGTMARMDILFEYEVPVGYDGVVIALYNHANAEKGSYIIDNFDEDTLFFRLNGEASVVKEAPENITEVTPKGEMLAVDGAAFDYSLFVHDNKYINSNGILAEEFFYIPEGKTVTKEDITKVIDVKNYYDESHEYTYSEEAQLFTVYILNGMVELEHLYEDYMWNTFVECFNTMSYNDLCATIEEKDESSEGIVKRYACEYIKAYTERYIWSK